MRARIARIRAQACDRPLLDRVGQPGQHASREEMRKVRRILALSGEPLLSQGRRWHIGAMSGHPHRIQRQTFDSTAVFDVSGWTIKVPESIYCA
jgi:hypothetical protein